MSAEPAPKSKSSQRPPSWGIAAVFFVVVAVIAIVVTDRAHPPREVARDPLELSDRRELAAVANAVSGVIRADNEAAEDAALRQLEALHPQTPGAADLRESCVTTYRGTHEAQRLTRDLRAMLPPDGGGIAPEVQSRMQTMLNRSQQLVIEARESHQRCVGLYEEATHRLGIEPARRPRAQ